MGILISGFNVIPVSYKSFVTHYLYARSHSSPKLHSSKIPPDGRFSCLISRMHKDNKEVPTITPLPSQSLRRLRKTGLAAHIVFLDSSSLDLALASPVHRVPGQFLPKNLMEFLIIDLYTTPCDHL